MHLKEILIERLGLLLIPTKESENRLVMKRQALHMTRSINFSLLGLLSDMAMLLSHCYSRNDQLVPVK